MIEALAGRLILLWGWRRFVVALTMGALSALAMPPYHAFPLLFFTIPVLIWLIDGTVGENESRTAAFRAAFATGWAFGFGFFIAGLFWIGNAFLVDAKAYAWAMPIALILLPGWLAVFPGLACGCARLLWKPGAGRIVALAFFWTLFALARGYVFTGFPWNMMGYSLTGMPEILQSVSVFGVYGLTFFTLLVAGAPAILSEPEEGTRRQGGPGWLFPAVLIILFAGLWGGGAWRLHNAQSSFVDGVSLRIVQPNIAQKDKWQPENRTRILSTLLELSDRASSPQHMGVSDITHLIWPEVALPYLMLENKNALSSIAALLPGHVQLITGAIRRDKPVTGKKARYYNSIMVLDGEGKTTAIYDKTHLVPFGEYLPFQQILEKIGIRQLTKLPGGFTPGPGSRNISIAGGPDFSPLICYEIIFPGKVTAKDKRPGFMVNVTNDAWYGDTSGPRQHFHQALVRAVEEGLPVIRAANSGISGVIDAYGRTHRKLALNNAGIIDSRLPAALAPTLYARFGGWILVFTLLFPGLFVLYYKKG